MKEKILTQDQRKRALLDRLPREGVEGDVITAFEYDTGADGEKADGAVIVTDKNVAVYLDGKLIKLFSVCGTDKFEFRRFVGVSEITAFDKDGEHLVCRASDTYREVLSKNVKRLQRLKETGTYKDDAELRIGAVCPKCGRRLNSNMTVCVKCADKRSMFKRILKMASPYKWYLMLSVLLFFAGFAVSLLGPYVNKLLVDGYIDSAEAKAAVSSGDRSVFTGFALTVGLMVLLTFLSYLFGSLRNLSIMKAGTGFIVDLRKLVFEQIQKMSVRTLSRRTSGELMRRVTGDTAQIENFVTGQLPNIVQQAVLLVAVGVILFIYDPFLAFLILIPVPVCIYAIWLCNEFFRRIYSRQWEAESRSGSVLYDIFSGIRVVKAHRTEKKELERFDRAITEERDIAIKNETLFNVVDPVFTFVLNIGSLLLMYYTGSRILGRTMTLGDAAMLSSYVTLIYGPIDWLAYLPRLLTRSVTSLVKIFDVLDEKQDIKDAENAAEPVIEGNIEIKDLTFGYDDGGDVLKGVDLSVKKGEMVGIVGRSGAGKSTLINLMMRMYDPDGGSITVDGYDLCQISQSCLRSQIGVVLQETFLFKETVYDNIAYAKPGCDKETVIAASKAAGAHQFIVKLPDGYDTVIGENGHTLSGGERQRISIARALLHDPKILILDEATASLDTETEKNIQDTLQKLTRDRTTIAIAHRLSTLRNATFLAVLDQGRIAECGSHDELMRKKGIYYGLVMAQRQMSRIGKKSDTAAS